MASLFYSGLIAVLMARAPAGIPLEPLQEQVFTNSLKAFPLCFPGLFLLLILLGRLLIRRNCLCFRLPD
ncbi:MAG: hypothetical protein ACP5I4_08585 [Oceanipulchritudo sp.]